MWAAAVAGATLAFTASAHADGLDWTPQWESAPVVQRADIDSALVAAQTYWSRVPGVPHVAEACGTLPGVQVARSDASGGRGRPAENGYPCRLWLTDTYLAMNAALPEATRYSKALCPLLVHELGHVLGLGHDFTGDPAMVMSYTFDGIDPAECATPEPATAKPAKARSCIPAWATATSRVTRLYSHGRKALARRAYHRWQRTHKARARRLARACAREV